MKKLCSSLFNASILSVLLSTACFGYKLFDEKGMATAELKKHLKLAGIENMKWDARSVIGFLDTIYFNKSMTYYKEGRKPSHFFALTSKMARDFLSYEYATYKTLLPKKPTCADWVMTDGDAYSIEQKLHSLGQFYESGGRCKQVYIIVKNDEQKKKIDTFINKQNCFINPVYVVTNATINITKIGLEKIKDKLDAFYIISFPGLVDEQDEIARQVAGKNYLGAVSVPKWDAKNHLIQDLKRYGVLGASNDDLDEAMIRQAHTRLNVLARKAFAEGAKFFKK